MRPAEGHFLVMLMRDLPQEAPPPESTLQLALQVRLLAEEAALGTSPSAADGGGFFHPYSELVWLWTRSQVEKADAERRRGEDFLFASGPEAATTALTHLRQAREQYVQAGHDAAIVRQALTQRDRLLAELPYYTQWLASRRISPDPKFRPRQLEEVEKLLTTTEELWTRVHALTALLEKPDPSHLRGGAESLEGRANEAAQLFTQQIEKAFDRYCRDLAEVHLQDRWQAIEDALTVPLIKDGDGNRPLRLRLLEASRKISSRLNPEAAAGDSVAPTVKPQEEAEEAARRQGRMAVALLGERYLREMKQERLADLVHRPDPARPWLSLTEAGDIMSRLRQQTLQEVQRLTLEGDQADDLRQAGSLFGQAAALCRLVDGAAAEAIPSQPLGPEEGDRNCRWHDLFLWLAQRTQRDHWFAEDEKKGEPYYVTAGKLYLADALRLAQVGEDPARNGKRQQEAHAAEAALLKPSRLEPVKVEDLALTSERHVQVRWRLQPFGDLPPGNPVAWPEVEDPLVLAPGLTPGRKILRLAPRGRRTAPGQPPGHRKTGIRSWPLGAAPEHPDSAWVVSRSADHGCGAGDLSA